MTKYNTSDPIALTCESCGCLYALYQTWIEPAELQEVACEECNSIIWKNRGGRRYNSSTSQPYSISGEFQGRIRKRSSRKETSETCDHEYRKERVDGMHTGDRKCDKCGDVSTSLPPS